MKKPQIPLTTIFLTLIICLAASVSIFFVQRGIIAGQAQTCFEQQEKAQALSAQIEAIFESVEAQLRSAAQDISMTEPDHDKQVHILSLLLNDDAYEDFVWLDSTGEEQLHLSRFEIGPSANFGGWASNDAFVIPQTTNVIHYGPVSLNETTSEPNIVISVPGPDDHVLVVTFRFKKIWNLIASLPQEEDENIYVVNDDNKVIAHRDPSIVLRETEFRAPETSGIQSGLDGEWVALGTAQIQLGKRPFTVISEKPVFGALIAVFSSILMLVSKGSIIIILIVLIVLVSGIAYKRFKSRHKDTNLAKTDTLDINNYR